MSAIVYRQGGRGEGWQVGNVCFTALLWYRLGCGRNHTSLMLPWYKPITIRQKRLEVSKPGVILCDTEQVLDKQMFTVLPS